MNTTPSGEMEETSKTTRHVNQYMIDRVQYKINRYRQRARGYRRIYWVMASTSAVGATLLPALINLPVDTRITTILSLIVAITIALDRVFRPREHWRNFDLVRALLRQEEMMFSTRSGPYSARQLQKDEDRFVRFVERVEAAIQKEREDTILMGTTQESGTQSSTPPHIPPED